MNLAQVVAFLRPKKRDTRYCEICKYFTQNGKPYCPTHVDHMPYVKGVIARVARRELDLTATEIVDGHPIGWEILHQIRFRGSVSIKRLAKDHQIPEVLVQAYVDLFTGLGLCEMFTKRSYIWVGVV